MAAQLLVGSYLGIRLVIGIVGLLLPWALIVIDWQFMTEGRQIRGSMSAYYHSPARDLFVGGLVAIGGFLLLYMTGRWRTWEFSLSSVAGFAVWTVAFPPGEPGRRGPSALRRLPGPPPCTAIQHKYGEGDVALVHAVGAGVFVVLLAGLCLVFALREFGHGRGARKLMGEERDAAAVWSRLRSEPVGWTRFLFTEAPRVPFYLGCGVVILFGGWWATWAGSPCRSGATPCSGCTSGRSSPSPRSGSRGWPRAGTWSGGWAGGQPQQRSRDRGRSRRRHDAAGVTALLGGGELFENDLPAVPAVRERQVSHARHGHVAHVLRTGESSAFRGHDPVVIGTDGDPASGAAEALVEGSVGVTRPAPG